MRSKAVKADRSWEAADLRMHVLANGSEDTISPLDLQVCCLRRRFDIGHRGGGGCCRPRVWKGAAMSTIKLTRQQRREMKKLAEKVDRVTNAHRLFFERFPQRRHRVRLASSAEIDQQSILDGRPPFVPEGCRMFTVVRNVLPGPRLRLFVRGIEGAETDVSEDVARAIFEGASTMQSRKIEAEMRWLWEERA